MAEKKITTGEVVGHLRAASRLFKSFEFANEAAELVLKAEASVTKLKKEINILEKEKESLNKECDRVVVKANKAEAAIVLHQKAVQEAASVASTAALEASTKAKVKVKDIITKAELVASEILDRTKVAKAGKDSAVAAQRKAESDLLMVTNKLQQAKESVLKAFG